MSISISRQAAFVGVRITDKLAVSRQASFTATLITDKLAVSRQAAFAVTRITDKLAISRQAAFLGVLKIAYPASPLLAYQTAMRVLRDELEPERMAGRRLGAFPDAAPTLTAPPASLYQPSGLTHLRLEAAFEASPMRRLGEMPKLIRPVVFVIT